MHPQSSCNVSPHVSHEHMGLHFRLSILIQVLDIATYTRASGHLYSRYNLLDGSGGVESLRNRCMMYS